MPPYNSTPLTIYTAQHLKHRPKKWHFLTGPALYGDSSRWHPGVRFGGPRLHCVAPCRFVYDADNTTVIVIMRLCLRLCKLADNRASFFFGDVQTFPCLILGDSVYCSVLRDKRSGIRSAFVRVVRAPSSCAGFYNNFYCHPPQQQQHKCSKQRASIPSAIPVPLQTYSS